MTNYLGKPGEPIDTPEQLNALQQELIEAPDTDPRILLTALDMERAEISERITGAVARNPFAPDTKRDITPLRGALERMLTGYLS